MGLTIMRASVFLVVAGFALALFGAVITTAGCLAFIVRGFAMGSKLFAAIRRALGMRARRADVSAAVLDALAAHDDISRGRP